ncbi:MAG TPA: CBS domain-containing protein [Pyrinomonadaceae bacterium]|jgi:CBS domain-containing protein|nr:CBS domain-containing protein [Pyrinomonadaceae bacterium]
MSRYRNDRDDDYHGGNRDARERGGYDTDSAARGDSYGRGGSPRDYDDYRRERTDDRSGGRREGFSGRGGGFGGRPEEFSGRSGWGGGRDEGFAGRERERYYDDAGYGRRAGRRGDDDDYERRERYERDEREGRSLLDEGREYFRRTFGGRGRETRGATRSHVRCRDIMTRDVTVATRQTMLEDVAKMMRDEDTGVIPVVERAAEDQTDLGTVRPDMNRTQANVSGNGKLVGLITDRDLVVRAIAEGKDARSTRAEEIMTAEVHTAQPNDRVLDAIRKMGDKQVRRIPVVDRDGTLRGIISMADVALETEEDRELADALEEISSGSSFWNRVFG